MITQISTALLLSLNLGPATEIPADVTPGYPEVSVPWVDWSCGSADLHLTSTTGATFELSTTPAVVDSVFNYSTQEFETTNVCPIPEAWMGLSGAISTYHGTLLVVAPGVGLIDIDPTTCDYDIVANGFLPPIDLGGGNFTPGLANSIAADWDGNVYVSDPLFGALYHWDGSSPSVEVIAQAPEMGQGDAECQMPPDLAMAPFFGINGLALSKDGEELYFLHSLPRGYMYAYDLDTGDIREIADFGCGVTPDELVVKKNGDVIVSMAFDASPTSLGSLATVDVETGEILDKISGPFTFSNDVTRTFGGPASIRCMPWPFTNHCAVANHYADAVGQPFETFWFIFDEKTWPVARPW